ncbi:hypothetical protein Tco_1195788 [Tanacetum coccineum]
MAPPGFALVQNNGQNRFNQNQGQENNFNRGNNFHGNQGFQAQNNHALNFQNQGFQNQPFQVPNNQVQQEISNDFSSYKRNNDQMLRNMQNQINSLKGDLKNEIQNNYKISTIRHDESTNYFSKLFCKTMILIVSKPILNFGHSSSNTIPNPKGEMKAITTRSGVAYEGPSIPTNPSPKSVVERETGTLPSNTIPNPKGEMKAITTRSGVAYEGPSIPTNPSPKKVVERETEEATDKEQSNFQGSTTQIPPPVTPILILEPDVPKSLPKPHIPYPSRLNQEKSRDKASNQKEKIFQMFQDLRFNISFADALLLMPRFAPTIKSLLMNKEKFLELAKISLNEN